MDQYKITIEGPDWPGAVRWTGRAEDRVDALERAAADLNFNSPSPRPRDDATDAGITGT